MQNEIIIFGASGHSKVIIDAIEQQQKYRLVGVVDIEKKPGTDFFGYPVLGPETKKSVLATKKGIIAIGDNFRRQAMVQKLLSLCPDFEYISVVHPSAQIARDVKIGLGTFIAAGAVLNPSVVIGEHCVINTNCSVDHDSLIGAFTTVAPGATLAGNVSVGPLSTVSLGACMALGRKLGSRCVLGAGAVLLEDASNEGLYVGIPAKLKLSEKKTHP